MTSSPFIQHLASLLGALEPTPQAWIERLYPDLGPELVLFGAGHLGSRLALHLRAQGVTVAAVADSDPSRWGQSCHGQTILSPQDAADRYGRHLPFLVAILNTGHDFRRTRRELLRRGVRRPLPVHAWLFRFPETFLPYYAFHPPQELAGALEAIEAAHGLWADASSRDLFEALLLWRVSHDDRLLSAPVAGDQYFPPDLVPSAPCACFVDLGAFAGDTVAPFLRWCRGDFQRYVAFEPDPANFARLEAGVAALGGALPARFELHPWAASGADGSLTFALDGSSSSSVAAGAGTPVRTVKLDSLPFPVPPSYLKMDIEGAELEALQGARELLRTHRPLLAISAYHTPDHLWRVPLALRDLLPDAQLYLRPHGFEGWDTVCYAVPRGSALPS